MKTKTVNKLERMTSWLFGSLFDGWRHVFWSKNYPVSIQPQQKYVVTCDDWQTLALSHSVIWSQTKKLCFFSVLVICYGVCADWHRAWNFATHCKPLNAKSHQQRQLTGRLWKPMGGQPSPAAMKCVFAGKKRRKTVKVCIAANLFIGKLQSCREMNVVASVQPKEKNIFAALLTSATTHK